MQILPGIDHYDLVCTDCIFAYFYAEDCEVDDREPNRRPLDRLEGRAISFPDDDEPFFSYGGCATCSTYLGGDRFEVTLS